MDRFDQFLFKLQPVTIQKRITEQYSDMDFNIDKTQPPIELDTKLLLSSFIDIIRLFLASETPQKNSDSQDSIIDFYLNYVHLKYESVKQGSSLAWKMVKELEEKGNKQREFKMILFLLEQDNKRSFCSFYIKVRNIMIEFLQGFESDYVLLDSLDMAIDQWSEISRRIFSGPEADPAIKKVAKVINFDQKQLSTFDATFRVSCSRLMEIYVWIYIKQINKALEQKQKYENQSSLRKEQRDLNVIPTCFYGWGNPLFQNTQFDDNEKYKNALKQNRDHKMVYPRSTVSKTFNSSPAKVKTYMPHLNVQGSPQYESPGQQMRETFTFIHKANNNFFNRKQYKMNSSSPMQKSINQTIGTSPGTQQFVSPFTMKASKGSPIQPKQSSSSSKKESYISELLFPSNIKTNPYSSYSGTH